MPGSYTPTDAILADQICSLFPEYKIQIRDTLAGGLSDASVFLIDFHLNGTQRLGVIKLTSAESALRETQGYERAGNSWLQAYLPEHIDCRGPIVDDGRHVVLLSLAKERRDDSEQLTRVLIDSFSYGRDVLRAVGVAYSQEATRLWAKEAPPVRTCDEVLEAIAQNGIEEAWLERWVEAGLPDKEHPSISFEDRDERWPNPVAFLYQKSLWNDTPPPSFSVPELTCHGDLNPQNVLCPNIHRQAALRLQSDEFNPNQLLKHISVIDPPFCFDAPFTYDLAFLAAWLQRALLPDFTSRSNVDVALSTYDAILKEISRGLPSQAVHVHGRNYADCVRELWQQASGANQAKQEDLRDAFLISLVAANLWQAIKAFGKAREEAISKICMASMALKLLLGQTHLAKPDFELWLHPETDKRRKWTSETSQIAAFLGALDRSNPLILVIGSQWTDQLDMLSDERVLQLAELPPNDLRQKLDEIASTAPPEELTSLGRLPASVVLDYSYFDVVSNAFKRGVVHHRKVREVHPKDQHSDWTDMQEVLFFSLRGTLRYPDTLAFDAKGKSRNRRWFRPFLQSFQRCHGAKAQVLIVGATPSEVAEVIAYLGDVWAESLDGVCIGASAESHGLLADWGIESVSGGIEDFLTATLDLAEAKTAEAHEGSSARSDGPTLMASGIRMVEDDIAIDKTSQEPQRVPIPLDDRDAFARAGQILNWEILASLDNRDRDPKQFFVGHRVLLSEVHQGVSIKRNGFDDYRQAVEQRLSDNYPQFLAIPSRPGAGASTVLLSLAYELAFKKYVPTLILQRGGQHAFEAIERLHRLVKRTFLVVADPEDVSTEEVRMLKSRCAPCQYPAIFLTTVRMSYESLSKQKKSQGQVKATEAPSLPILSLELDSTTEREQFLRTMARYCPSVRLASVASSSATSFFLLSLDAFGGERIDVDRFVTQTMSHGSPLARSLLATVALFSRFAHRICTTEFLEIVSNCRGTEIEEALAPYQQLLVLQENDGWACRHEELSKRILQYYLVGGFEGDEYRSRLSDLVCSELLEDVDDQVPGCEIVADYIWSLMNPQLEASRSVNDERSVSRLLGSEDGLRYDEDRYKLQLCAAQTFPRHVSIISHFGKYLAETEKKFDEADKYLQAAYDLDPENRAVMHMIGKRYKDEAQQKIETVKADAREVRDNARIDDLTKLAHEWFDRARICDVGSEYNYTTPVVLDILLINDEYHKLGLAKRNQAGRAEKFSEPRITQLFAHADSLIAEGLRYIEPREESRRVFNYVRSELTKLRGDLDAAIASLEKQVVRVAAGSRPTLSVQLARYLVERGERGWRDNDAGVAIRDFKKAEKYLDFVLQDPGQTQNLKLWFDSARHLAHLTRNELLQRMLRYHDRDPGNLDGCFLLMCLYFCEAVETRSQDAWRKCNQFAALSSQLSNTLAVRRTTREWLVEVNTGFGPEYRFYPAHLYSSGHDNNLTIEDNGRLRLKGKISDCKRSTVGLVRIEDCGFEVFFRPRIVGREYYQSDEGARVEFLVSFMYEKPQAFDVRRIES